MRKKTRNVMLCAVSALALSLGAVGLGSMNTRIASADAQTANVDLLGKFEWDEVAGATAYEVSYAIGEENYTFTAESNEANVSEALMQAVNASQTEVTFEVTPKGVDGASATSYAKEITEYVDYAYTSHDISDYNAKLKYPTKLSDITTDSGLPAYWISSAAYKNDLLTLGFRADQTISGNEGFFVGLFDAYATGDKGALSCNYRINQRATGEVTLALLGTSVTNTNNIVHARFAAGTDYNTPISYGTPYYLSMGVFDTYDVSGAFIGETVYYTRSVYDADLDELVEVGGFTCFVEKATIEAKGITYTEDTVLKSGLNRMVTDRDAILINVRGYVDTAKTMLRQDYVYVFSGKPSYSGMDAPDGLYYDNADASLYWNEVEGASEYEWRVGNENWQKAKARKASLENYFTEYKELGFLPLSVRAVGGKTATYRLDLKRFYATRSTVKDFTALTKDSKNQPKFITDGIHDNWYGGGKAFYNTGFGYGDRMTFAMKVLTESTTKAIGTIGFFGASNAFDYANRYWMILQGNGTVSFGNFISAWNTNDRSQDKYWRVNKVVDGFVCGEMYYFTYGIDEVYENGVKVADRIFVRVEEETNGGLDRETVSVISFDNEMFDVEYWEAKNAEGVVQKFDNKEDALAYAGGETQTANVKQISYKVAEGDTLQVGVDKDFCRGLVANKDTNTKVSFTMNGQTVATKTVDFGSHYDFNDIEANQTAPVGYELAGWEYEFKGKKRDFTFDGVWGLRTEEEVEVAAKLTPVTYNVSYGVACNNPTNYTTESAWTLDKPAVIPVGKVFDAWYDANDTARQYPLTTLEGKTGDITLIANFVDGYSVTVQAGDATSVIDYKAGDEPITISAPEIENKTFVKWTKLEDGEYVDHTDKQSFTCLPNGAHSFKAVYAWTEYKVEYVADGGAHENAGTYTVKNGITFEDAEKDGYFFLGWYADETFTTKVTETNASGDMKVYAKFIEHALPVNVKIDRSAIQQELPAPKLSDGASYVVALSLNGENVEIKNNAYAFDKAGNYELTYTVTLAGGETCSYKVAYAVADVYTVNVHSANETVTLKKNGGETLAESEIPATPEGYEFGGLYTDSEYKNAYDKTKAIDGDTNIYVKWVPVVQSEPVKEMNGAALGTGIGVLVVCIGAAAAVVVLSIKKKKD